MTQHQVGDAPLTQHALHGDMQLVTFYLGEELFAVSMTAVREIIRMPTVARLPLSTPNMLGLANLRGALLPVADLSCMLFGKFTTLTDATRVMVVDLGNPVGMVVDHVDKVIHVDSANLDTADVLDSSVSGEMLSGVIKNAGGHKMIVVLDAHQLLSGELARVSHQGYGTTTSSAPNQATAHQHQEEETKIVAFSLGGEEFAFPIDQVEEIINLPEQISRLPKSSAHLLGMINLRNRLIPLVSLRQLFGFADDVFDDTNKVIILTIPGVECHHSVGILTDQVNAVLKIPASKIENLPQFYEKRRAHAEIDAICNVDDGQRMISLLASDRLLDPESLHMVISAAKGVASDTLSRSSRKMLDTETQFVVFLLAGEEYGVPIQHVQEIIRIPEVLAHVPNAPPYVEGMVNLRGVLLPAINLRSRVGLPKDERNDQQRIIVLTWQGGKTGFIVDSVTEVVKLPSHCIEATSDFAGDLNHLLTGVANLPSSNRMILILDVASLIHRKKNLEPTILPSPEE